MASKVIVALFAFAAIASASTVIDLTSSNFDEVR
jgi:hypothetical protein